MECVRCAAPLPAEARFCPTCGTPVARRIEGERRVVTVLFCDVKGSTAIAESRDPEDWAEIMGGAFAILRAPVERYDGTVARVMGDGILAYFGAPTAHEDDPERAVLAALEMHAAIATYRGQLQAERGIPEFDVRIGINTGLAVLGDVAGGIEYSAMGDAVNVAARLQAAAPAGGIVVGEATERLVAGRFETRPLGPLDLRGRSGTVEAFEIAGRRVEEERSRPPQALVGRAAELATLREAIADVRTGRGRIVALVGDAGLGKTRLLDEVHAEWRADAAAGRWSEARGQSYAGSQPYALIREHLLAWIGARPSDPPAAIRERIAAESADEAIGERGRMALEALTGVEAEASGTELAGEAFRLELTRVLIALAHRPERYPGVFVFDDLHWSDPASVELLGELVPLVDELPLLFLCSFRPDRQSPAWRFKQRVETDFPHVYSEVALGALDAPDSEVLLRQLLLGAQLPSRLRERVLDKAEGNPLFLEEIVRSLRQDGIVRRHDGGWSVDPNAADVRLPDSLQGIVASRIDRLDEETRQTLQAASVIGRTFEYRVLRRLVGGDGKLDRQLVALQRIELVRELRRETDRAFAFRHALTQEAAYASILQRRRRELHREVGTILEELDADRVQEQAAIIGHHLAEAGDARAVGHLRVAGERAMRLHALEEALAHFDRAIALLPADAPPEVAQGLLVGKGRTHELRAQYDEAIAAYEELERRGAAAGDTRLELAGLARRITVFATPTPRRDLPEAERLLERALALARERDDRTALARLQWDHALIARWRTRAEESIAAGEEAIALAKEIGDRELAALVMSDISPMYTVARGDRRRTRELLGEAAAIFQDMGNKPMLADNLGMTAFMHVWAGELDAALVANSEERAIAQEIGNKWNISFSTFASGYVHAHRGDWGLAIETWEEGIRVGAEAGFLAIQVGPRADLGWLYHHAGDDERAEAHLLAADALAERSMTDWRAWTLGQRARFEHARGAIDRARELAALALKAPRPLILAGGSAARLAAAELALADGDADGALRIIEDERRVPGSNSIPMDLDELDRIAAEAQRRAGDPAAAAATLERAIERSRRTGSNAGLWRLLADLAALRESPGRDGEAERLRAEARSIVDRITLSLERVGLAERFRERADRILGQRSAA